MEEENKDVQDNEVIVTDLEPSEHALNLSNVWRKAHLFFLRHRKMWKRILFLGFLVVLVIGVLSIPPLRNNWWSKISGIPLDAVTIRIQHRDLYAQRQIDGSLAWHVTLDSSPEGAAHIADQMPYRILCNDVQPEGAKPCPDRASRLFSYVPLHKIWALPHFPC